MEYTIERSNRRKTLQLGLGPDGAVVVKAPVWSKKGHIDEFVNAHADWIKVKRQKLLEVSDAKENFSVNIGDSISIFGTEYPVLKSDGNNVRFDDEGLYIPDMPFEYIKPALVKILRAVAKDMITQTADYWSGITGFRYSMLSINGAAKRWASRSSTGRLNFSWRLVFADSELVDYVVIHELCHTAEMNHSAAFWAHVAKYCPDYKQKRKRLGELYDRLLYQDWE